MEHGTELVENFINSAVAGAHLADATCVARNAISQSEITFHALDHAPGDPGISEIGEHDLPSEITPSSGTVPELDSESPATARTTSVDAVLASITETDREAIAATLSDDEIVEQMEKQVFAPIRAACAPLAEIKTKAKDIIRNNHALIMVAKKRFNAPGRRVPVVNPDGKKEPTYTEWLKANLTCSDRYVRKILSELSKALNLEPPHEKKPPKKSPAREREEQILFLAIKQAEAIFTNPEQARELAAMVLKVADLPCPVVAVPSATDVQALKAQDQTIDWKNVVVQLIATMEQYGEKLPIPVFNEKRAAEKLLAGKTTQQEMTGVRSASAGNVTGKRGCRVEERSEGGHSVPYYAVIRDGKTYATLPVRTEAEAMCQSLHTSPVSSIRDAEPVRKQAS